MTNDKRIEIIEKPDWVTWEEIHQVLWKAHEQNRQKGMFMGLPAKSAEELQKYIEGKGKMFVALDEKRVIGTLAIIVKEGNQWYNHGKYGYACLGAVLPESSGKGVFRALDDKLESEARYMQLPVITGDTHENNARMLKISKKEGYQFVSYKACKDHFNIVRAKWLNGCPFSDKFINRRFKIARFLTRMQYKPGKVERSRVISFFCKAAKNILLIR